MELLRVPSRKAALAFGLKWVLIDTFERLHRQVSRWKAEGVSEHASYRVDADTVYGLVRESMSPADQQQVRGLRLLAAGACAATLPQLKGKTALVLIDLAVEQAGEAGVAVLGIDKGIVVVDMLCDTGSQVSEARQAFAQRVKGEFEVHGSGPAAGQVHHALRLEDLVQKGGVFSPLPTIEPLRSGRGYWLAGGVAAALLLFAGGIAAWDSHHAEIKRRTQLAAMDANKPENLYKQSIFALLQRSFVPLPGAIEAMRVGLAEFPLVHAGWELQKVSCPSTGECSVRFKRIVGSGATIDGFRQSAPATWVGVTASGQDEVAFMYRLAFPSMKLHRESWPKADDFRDRNYAAWQTLEPAGWKAEFSPLAIQALPANIQAKDVMLLHSHPEAVFAMPVAINQQPWWYAGSDPDSPVRVDMLGDHTVLDGEIELLHLNKAVVFSAKGLSYVQK